MFFTDFVLCILRSFKFKTEGQTINRKFHRKATKLSSQSSLNLGYLNRALITGPGAPLLGLVKSIY